MITKQINKEIKTMVYADLSFHVGNLSTEGQGMTTAVLEASARAMIMVVTFGYQ